VCQTGGLKVVGQYREPAELVELALRDKPYYDRSGGGLTLSGGEPMSQFEPLLKTMQLARDAGLHTCLDTCGQASTDHYLRIAPYVNLFLWDYKATDPILHKELTGADGELIKKNLVVLYENGANIRLRCPLIPGMNDQPEHLEAIARLSKEMPNLDGIDIMPYHSYGREKAEKVGLVQEGLPAESASAEQIKAWMDQFAALGCDRVSIG
jgi:pyruvate formate lyase activating enzyme